MLNPATLHTNYAIEALKNADGTFPDNYKQARNNFFPKEENSYLFQGLEKVPGTDKNFTVIHDDSIEQPTIGYGLNLAPLSFEEIKSAYLAAYNGNLTAQQDAGLEIIREWKNGNLSNRQLIAIAQGNDNTTEETNLQSLSLRHEEANRLLEATLDGSLGFGNYESGLSNRLDAGDVGQSTERIALLSAFYNAPALIGAGMQYALQGQPQELARAAAWFELRFNHTNTILQGRRDRESNLLHLVSADTGKDRIEEIKYALDFLFNGTTKGAREQTVDVYQTIQSKQLNPAYRPSGISYFTYSPHPVAHMGGSAGAPLKADSACWPRVF